MKNVIGDPLVSDRKVRDNIKSNRVSMVSLQAVVPVTDWSVNKGDADRFKKNMIKHNNELPLKNFKTELEPPVENIPRQYMQKFIDW